jgi:hypothetical protein
MVQPAFDIGNPQPGEGYLLIEVSAQSLNYILYKKDPQQLLLLRQYRLYTTGDRSSRDLIDEVIDADTVFQQHADRALIVYNFPESSIVPSELYNDESRNSMTTLLYGDDSNDILFGEEVKGRDMHNAYRVPRDIHSLLKEKFKGGQYWHIYTLMLLCGNGQHPTKEKVIRTVFYHDKFIAAFYNNDQLQLIQTFNYQTPEDVAYYLLLVCKQFNFGQQDIALFVSGLIDSQSALYTELLKYFAYVQEEGLPGDMEINSMLEEFPAHYFSPLLKMSLCGL